MTTAEGGKLVSAIQRRERTAWATFYDQHVRQVYAFVSHLVQGNQAVAEELNQEVWLTAIDNIDKFDPHRGTLRNWVLGIARNKVALHFRRQGADRDVPLDRQPGDICGGLSGTPVLPQDCVQNVEQASLVRAAMAGLSESRRQVLNGKYIEGLSVREIAERSGKTPKAVESLLSRARAELRELLRDVVQ